MHHKRVNTGFNSVPRDVAGHLDYRRCVGIRRSSAVLRRGSEIPLRKQRDPQAPAGQQLHERSSDAHQAPLRHRRRPPRHGRTHPCAGASVVTALDKVNRYSYRFSLSITTLRKRPKALNARKKSVNFFYKKNDKYSQRVHEVYSIQSDLLSQNNIFVFVSHSAPTGA